MSKQLYEEALADARQLKAVAEDNAKRALVEAVTPRIRELIERELLKESDDGDADEDDFDTQVVAPSSPDKLLTDDQVTDGDVVAAAISAPDASGKVTLDLDALASDEGGVPVEKPMFGMPTEEIDEYELSLESLEALKPVLTSVKKSHSPLATLGNLGEELKRFKSASNKLKVLPSYNDKIAQMISRVENMYDYVQESVKDPARKSSYEVTLESYFKDLNILQEQKMSKKSLKDMLNEGDVTLKLTGLPDEIDLDSVGVDLITGEEGDEEATEEPSDEEAPADGEEESDDLDLDLDMGDEEETDEDDSQVEESEDLDDDTVVEIDEGMLRREILRMKGLRENAAEKSVKGNGPGVKGEDVYDVDMTTESEDVDGDQMTEVEMEDEMEDESCMEGDEVDMDQAEDARDHSGDVAPPSMGPGAKSNKQSRSPELTSESAKARIEFEKRLQERLSARSEALKVSGKKASVIKTERAQLATRFAESVNRVKKFSKVLAEAATRKGATKNGGPTQPAEQLAESNLRNKLAESNLFNAKLVYTNKLLQSDVLSKKQKASIVEKLDEAKSIREVKLVYESLSKALAGSSRPMNESANRQVVGSSSRTTRSAGAPINEGYETNRWAKLAGIITK